MALKKFLNICDNWNMKVRITNCSLQLQYQGTIRWLFDNPSAKSLLLLNTLVVSFGFHNDELTIQVDA